MLHEREPELATLDAALHSAAQGTPSLIAVAGPLGIGRSALLEQFAALAAGQDVLVLRANAAPMERDFPFGVLRQLFDTLLACTDDQQRERWTRDAAFARQVFTHECLSVEEDEGPDGAAPAETILHDLRTLLADISAEARLLILVDDLEWADGPSVRFLAYLAKRLRGLRLVLVCTVRDGEPGTRTPAVCEVTDAAHTVLRPEPLSLDGVKAMVRDRFGEPGDEEFVAACQEVSRGNPLFLTSVLAELATGGCPRPTADQAAQVRGLRPASLRERLASCLRSQRRPVRDMAAAIAILDERPEPELVIRLAGLDPIGAASALRVLRRLGLLDAEQRTTRFSHPVVKDAVESSMTGTDRHRWHDAAADLLYSYGCSPEQVAVQLMAVTVSRRPWAGSVLRAAAEAALHRGEPHAAASYLRRALLDHAVEGEERARLLLELATAERLFDPGACERHITQAIPLLSTARDRAAAALRISPTFLGPAGPTVLELLRRTAGNLGPAACLDGTARQVALRLEARLRHAGSDDPAELAAGFARLGELAGDEPAVRSGAERELLGVLLHQATLTARLPAAEAARLAHRILEREPATPLRVYSALPLVMLVLVSADSLDIVDSWLWAERQAGEAAGGTAAPPAGHRFLTVPQALNHAEQAVLLSARGRPVQARAHAERATLLSDADWREAGLLPAVALAGVALESHAPDLGERLLAREAGRGQTYLALTAWLGLVKGALEAENGRWNVALDDVLASGRQTEAAGWTNPAVLPWRPHAISLYHRLGDTHSAMALAEEECARAADWGAPAALGRALRLKGCLDGGPAGVATLREAVDVLHRSANQLELARALLALGRRLEGGAGAEAVLREGEALAVACGAPALTRGPARAGRPAASGPEPALTRQERRVAELAKRGLTNQEIAQELGVSSRAVEKHLTNSYRKLGVSGRRELLAAISE